MHARREADKVLRQLEGLAAINLRRVPALVPYARQPYLRYVVYGLLGTPFALLLLALGTLPMAQTLLTALTCSSPLLPCACWSGRYTLRLSRLGNELNNHLEAMLADCLLPFVLCR